MRTRTAAAALLVCGSSVFAQAPPARPEFEAAVIKLNKSGADDASFQMSPSGLFSARNTPLNDMFEFAFHVRREAMLGAPAWFNTDRVDVIGRAPENTPGETFQQMLKTLLIQEFNVVFHREQRTMRALALTVGKGGPKLQNAAGTGEEDCKGAGDKHQQSGRTHVACTNMKMSDLADELSDLASSYISRTVVDQTGLTGTYDITLDWVGRNNIDTIGGVTIFDALEKLGLKLEEKKLVVPVVVIDHVEKLAEN